MVIAVAFSHVDANLVHEQAEQIAHLGGCPGHTLMLMASAQAKEQLPAFKAKLSPSFDKTHALVADIKERGFPQSANDLFRHTLFQLQRLGNKEPIFYCEPDVAPLKSGWANTLLTQFNLSKKRFLGVIQPTTFYRNGRYEKDPAELHMVGAGVYAADFAFRSKLLNYAQEEPWDTYMRWEITPEAQHTELIQHNWNTRNYRRDEQTGNIVCDPGNHLAVARPLRTDAVVLHGCKDGSIYRALKMPDRGFIPIDLSQMPPKERAMTQVFIEQAPLTVRRKRGVSMKKGRARKGSNNYVKIKQ